MSHSADNHFCMESASQIDAKALVAETRDAIDSNSAGPTPSTGTEAAVAESGNGSKSLLARACMYEAGKGLTEVLRYLACICIALYNLPEPKSTVGAAGAATTAISPRAKLLSLQTKLQVHAAALQVNETDSPFPRLRVAGRASPISNY